MRPIRYVGCALLVALCRTVCSAGLLLNEGFDSGNLGGWTTFTTLNGNLGSASGCPSAALFDVDGDGNSSYAACFQVGEAVYNSGTGHTSQGGGLYQSFSTAAGIYDFRVKLAAQAVPGWENDTAGVFTLYVDGVSVASADFKALLGGADIQGGQIERTSFFVERSLSAGTHEVRLQITRNWLTATTTPFEYVDDFSVAPIPEPGTWSLLVVGLGGLWALGRGRRR